MLPTVPVCVVQIELPVIEAGGTRGRDGGIGLDLLITRVSRRTAVLAHVDTTIPSILNIECRTPPPRRPTTVRHPQVKASSYPQTLDPGLTRTLCSLLSARSRVHVASPGLSCLTSIGISWPETRTRINNSHNRRPSSSIAPATFDDAYNKPSSRLRARSRH